MARRLGSWADRGKDSRSRRKKTEPLLEGDSVFLNVRECLTLKCFHRYTERSRAFQRPIFEYVLGAERN